MTNIKLPKISFKVERWKYNKELHIYVSNYGNFLDNDKKPIPIKIDNSGYVRIRVGRTLHLAHRVVMTTWRPIVNPIGATVDHLNHNKRDNSLKNLEWVSKEENIRRAISDFVLDPKGSIGNAKFIMQTSYINCISKWLKQEYHLEKSYKKINKDIRDSMNSGEPYCGYNFMYLNNRYVVVEFPTCEVTENDIWWKD